MTTGEKLTMNVPTRWMGSGPRKYPSRGVGPGRGPRDCAHCGLSCGPSDDDP